MEVRNIFIFTLITTALHLVMGTPAHAQSNIESLRDLMRQQSAEKVRNGRISDVEALVSEATERELIRARQSGKSGNIQIRRGNTSGVDQEQVGEGNLQSISVGGGN